MKKFNLKLTASVVSLFITFIFFAFGNTNKICLFFGFMFLATALVMFLFYMLDRFNAQINKASDMLEQFDATPEKEEYIVNLSLKHSLIKKKHRLEALFYFAAGLIVLVAIISLL